MHARPSRAARGRSSSASSARPPSPRHTVARPASKRSRLRPHRRAPIERGQPSCSERPGNRQRRMPPVTADVMDFRLLGALEVSANGAVADLGPPKQRALLAILLLHAGEIVPIDRLIDLLWGEHPPRTAAHSIQIYVSDLRRALESLGGAARSLPLEHPVPARHRPRDDRRPSLRAAGRGRDAAASRRAIPTAAPRPANGAAPVARAGPVGLRLRGVRPALHPPLPRPAPRCDRAGRGRRARGRACRGGRADAGRRDPRGSAARAVQGARSCSPCTGADDIPRRCGPTSSSASCSRTSSALIRLPRFSACRSGSCSMTRRSCHSPSSQLRPRRIATLQGPSLVHRGRCPRLLRPRRARRAAPRDPGHELASRRPGRSFRVGQVERDRRWPDPSAARGGDSRIGALDRSPRWSPARAHSPRSRPSSLRPPASRTASRRCLLSMMHPRSADPLPILPAGRTRAPGHRPVRGAVHDRR